MLRLSVCRMFAYIEIAEIEVFITESPPEWPERVDTCLISACHPWQYPLFPAVYRSLFDCSLDIATTLRLWWSEYRTENSYFLVIIILFIIIMGMTFISQNILKYLKMFLMKMFKFRREIITVFFDVFSPLKLINFGCIGGVDSCTHFLEFHWQINTCRRSFEFENLVSVFVDNIQSIYQSEGYTKSSDSLLRRWTSEATFRDIST